MSESKKQSARLENWRHSGKFLNGEIYGHPQLKDGTIVTTSKLIAFNAKEKSAETLHTYYTLGNPA